MGNVIWMDCVTFLGGHCTPSLISFIEGSVTMVKSVTLWSLNRSERIRLGVKRRDFAG